MVTLMSQKRTNSLYNWLKHNHDHFISLQNGEKSSRLTSERISQLDAIGFDFIEFGAGKRQNKTWNDRFHELRDFNDAHGHFKVPGNTGAHDSLYKWLRKNEQHYLLLQKGEKSSRLTSKRMSQLKAIGFEFDANKRAYKSWNERVQELKEFKETHGHFVVPSKTGKYDSLYHWLTFNHNHYISLQHGEKNSRLTRERISQLNAIGFCFIDELGAGKRQNKTWNDRFQELKAFQEDPWSLHKVSGKNEAYRQLRTWLQNNQYHYSLLQEGKKSSRLTSERLLQLKAIGFAFVKIGVRQVKSWNERVQELEEFKDTHGDFTVPDNTEEYKSLLSWMKNNQAAYNKFRP